MNVGNGPQTISLKGDIVVKEGEIMVELISSDDEIVFINHLKSPESLTVNESFQAVPGKWKLKYRSIEGTGSLALHLMDS